MVCSQIGLSYRNPEDYVSVDRTHPILRLWPRRTTTPGTTAGVAINRSVSELAGPTAPAIPGPPRTIRALGPEGAVDKALDGC